VADQITHLGVAAASWACQHAVAVAQRGPRAPSDQFHPKHSLRTLTYMHPFLLDNAIS
jgi:hypothetical protein